jgi:predicted dehydrogenase
VRTPIRVGIVGLGDRGIRLARTFDRLPGAEIRWLCDRSPDVRMEHRSRFSTAEWTASFGDILTDDGVDAVVIATPSSNRFELALRALEADKHVFVEQPIALRGEEAQVLVDEAEARDRILSVGNAVLFQPAVRKLKELVVVGALGDVYYLHADRHRVGRIRSDEHALWDLGAQEVAVVLYLLDDQPIEVAARGESFLHGEMPDVVFVYLKFATGISAHLHLSWLDPLEQRRTTVVGAERMVVIDDLEPERKLTIYDKREPEAMESFSEHGEARIGDIVSPRLRREDPTLLECESFVARIRSQIGRGSNGRDGATVVEILEALQTSLDSGGLAQPFVSRSRVTPNRGVIPLVASRDVR